MARLKKPEQLVVVVPSVVGTGSHKAHGEDGVVSDLLVCVVGILVEHVDDAQLRVRDICECDG